jgi:predicted Zn-dependent protease
MAVRISPETENKIGDMLYQTILDEQEIQDDKRIEYLETLINSLAGETETIRLPLKIHLIDSDTVNAAITVGGHVFIYTPLLEYVTSENELAFVLAHELGHFQNYDPSKSLGRSLVFITLSMTLGIGTSQSGGLPSVVTMTEKLTSLSYSRKQEKRADFYGLSRIVNYYGHGGHSLNFFERLESGEGKTGHWQKVSSYFSSHPHSKERIAYLRQKAAEKGWDMQGAATPLPKWLYSKISDDDNVSISH